jgi:hypothetical protein
MEIDIELDSFNKIYNVGDIITGGVYINCHEKQMDFSYIQLTLIVIHYNN